MADLTLAFDFDGTLADTRSVFERCFREALAHHGLQEAIRPDAFLRLFDGNFTAGVAGQGVPPEMCPDLMITLGAALGDHVGEMHLFPGIREMLHVLSERCPLVVITSNVSAVVRSVLRREGLDRVICEVWGTDVEPSKIRKLAMVRARWPRRSPVYVGDTLGDMLEARGADTIPVAVCWGWHTPEHLAKASPEAMVGSPETLVEWVAGAIEGHGSGLGKGMRAAR